MHRATYLTLPQAKNIEERVTYTYTFMHIHASTKLSVGESYEELKNNNVTDTLNYLCEMMLEIKTNCHNLKILVY